LRTNLVGEAAQGGAALAAGEPEEERGVAGGLGLGLDQVVEELRAGVLVHLHVPFIYRAIYNLSFRAAVNATYVRTLFRGGRGGGPRSPGGW